MYKYTIYISHEVLSRQSGLDEGQPKSCFGRPTCLCSLLNNK